MVKMCEYGGDDANVDEKSGWEGRRDSEALLCPSGAKLRLTCGYMGSERERGKRALFNPFPIRLALGVLYEAERLFLRLSELSFTRTLSSYYPSFPPRKKYEQVGLCL